MRLLLVEDHPLNQVVACGMLEHAGAQVQVEALLAKIAKEEA